MFTSLFQVLTERARLIRSLDDLTGRADDHLLDDIGLTREDVRKLRATAPRLVALRQATRRGLAFSR